MCKVCIYYNPIEKTCVQSVIAVSPGKIHHDYAKFVRLDQKRCGHKGAWFMGILGQDGIAVTGLHNLCIDAEGPMGYFPYDK
jgi:hypothetical protein